MRIEIGRIGRTEMVSVTRSDGSRTGFSVPGKGPVSHDIIHFCVESVLRLERGFWGMVASGEDPEAIQEFAKAGGHASAKRAGTPADGLVQLLQAERMVECFEAESWSGGSDDEGLRSMAVAGWSASQVPPLNLTADAIASIRLSIEDYGNRWKGLSDGETMILEWRE